MTCMGEYIRNRDNIKKSVSLQNHCKCSGKLCYNSKNEANREINRMMKESFGGVGDLRCYKCKYCKSYHLTSNIK